MQHLKKPKQNETAKQLLKIRCELNYLQRQFTRMRNLERKQDTRRKIQLGGLIKKAGLDEESTAVILGLLLEAKQRIQSDHDGSVRSEWRLLGDISLTIGATY